MAMRVKLWLPLWMGLLTAHLDAASIQFQATSLGGNAFSYTYTLSGVVFQANRELDLPIDPAPYGPLSNEVVGGFSPLLLQPDNPPGMSGDYSVLALAGDPSLAGPFSVNFIFNGPGVPGSQPYFIKQFDPNGILVSTL